MTRYPITLTVNGERRELSVAPHRTLLDVLRNDLDLRGANRGCDSGDCGACTVLMTRPGIARCQAITSCMVLAVDADGAEITTIEGLARDGDPSTLLSQDSGSRRTDLHPLQQAFIEHGAVQCGFCTPGMIMTAVALLEENPHPTEAEVRAGLAGNLCRCTGYAKIVEAVLAASAYRASDEHVFGVV